MHKCITPIGLLRACRCTCSCAPASSSRMAAVAAGPFGHYQQTRFASHAAAFNDAAAEDQQRQRARPGRAASDYRFPAKGKRGGPPDPFEVLGLERTADGAEIKSAYYALALVLHPDSSHPSASAEHFATLNKAYKLLSTQAGRNSYLSTGYGWQGGSFDVGYSESSTDAAMREVIRRARRAGASEWGGRGFRDSDAGKGAWTYRNVDGKQWHPYDADGHATGGGEELYMSNNKFVSLIAAIAGIVAFIQFIRMNELADNTREMLVDRHIHASKALEEARREAAMFGKERREQVRRRVRENAVLEEIEKYHRGEGFLHSQPNIPVQEPSLALPPPSPAPPRSASAGGGH